MSASITNEAGGPLIKLSSVKKLYSANGAGVEALSGIDLVVEKGEFVAVTGESGSGKSTLLSVLGGIAPPTSGDVLIDGIALYGLGIERLADFRREFIGFVFQQFHLMPFLTAIENVMLPLVAAGRKDMRERAGQCLEQVGLSAKAARLPSALSGGEQQRVAIARALVNEPPIVLADEPTGNLDTKTGEEIFSLFSALNRSGQTVIIVTHNPSLSARTHRVVSLKDGKVLRE